MSWRIGDESVFADALALRLRHVAAQLQPSDAFRSSLRTTLTFEAATVLTAGGPAVMAGGPRWQLSIPAATRRRAAIIAAALATTSGVVGMTAASASALPGDALYPVKRGVENAKLALKRGDSEQGMFRLDMAGERLQETSGLTDRPSTPAALEADTLGDYSEQADLGSRALERAFKETNRRGNIIAINHFATRAAGQLEDLAGRLEGSAKDAVESARTQLAGIVTTSTALCPACGGADSALIGELTGAGAGPNVVPPPSTPPAAAPEPGPPHVGVPAANPSSDHSDGSAASDNQSDSSDSSSNSSDSSDSSDSNTGSTRPRPSPTPTPSPSANPSPSPTAQPAAPTADFTWRGHPGVGNELRVMFMDTSSADATGWAWDFGDHTSSQVQNPPSHTYPAAGTYAVTLTVTNDAGGSNAVTKNVTVPVTDSGSEESAASVDQQLVQGLLNGFANLIGDVE